MQEMKIKEGKLDLCKEEGHQVEWDRDTSGNLIYYPTMEGISLKGVCQRCGHYISEHYLFSCFWDDAINKSTDVGDSIIV